MLTGHRGPEVGGVSRLCVPDRTVGTAAAKRSSNLLPYVDMAAERSPSGSADAEHSGEPAVGAAGAQAPRDDRDSRVKRVRLAPRGHRRPRLPRETRTAGAQGPQTTVALLLPGRDVRAGWDTRPMASEVRIARTGAAILSALQDVSPAEAVTFADEYRKALQRASASLDLAESERLLDRWWGVAYMRLNPPTAEELEIRRRLDAGEEVGWPSPQARLGAHGR